MDMEFIIVLLAAAVKIGTPLLFATLGETITEKSGNLNLGVEGMMLMGAVIGFTAGHQTGSPAWALIGAMAAGGAGALIFAFLTITLRANQIVTGLALTIFGGGFSGFLGKSMMGMVVPEGIKSFFAPLSIPILSNIPIVGRVFFQQDIFVYLGYVMAIVLGLYFSYTRTGLNLAMTGENPAAADAAGIPVARYRYIHTIIGGFLCGLAGAYLSLVYVPAWQENVTAGRGWIAVALVIFCGWSPLKALFGAYLFGMLDILGLRIQKFDIQVSPYFIDMVPYVVTIAILVLSAFSKNRRKGSPAALGLSYFREER